MQSVAETLQVRNLEEEISRLRLVIGDLRNELEMWLGDADDDYTIEEAREWQAETDKLMYGGSDDTNPAK
jgi:hypothetical protein